MFLCYANSHVYVAPIDTTIIDPLLHTCIVLTYDNREGFAYGFRDFGTGLVKGIGSVVYEPINGAIDEGVTGLGKGVVKGVLG